LGNRGASLLSVNRLHPKLGCDGGCDLVAQAQQEK